MSPLDRKERPRRHRPGKPAQRLECPFTWDDLVVPDEVRERLEDLLSEARERMILSQRDEVRRLFPEGVGIFGLFSGPAGTGKTMAARIIAASLDLDLYRIDLSMVVSKYIGETEKNLKRVFDRADAARILLFFDEADALFGKRTEVRDAHDRYANLETDYLIQPFELYKGLTIFASKRREPLDETFIRRLQFSIEFPLPDEEQREEIWRRLLAELGGKKAAESLAEELNSLAAIDVTGAQIKYAVLDAILSARREGRSIGRHYLLRGLERELAKAGRTLPKEPADR